MSKQTGSSRRSVVKQGLVLGLGLTGAALPAKAMAAAEYTPVVLSQRELTTLKALMSRLIPADEKSGGAVEARAYVYIDRALKGRYAKHRDTYRDGLAALDQWAERAKFAGFAAMPAPEMDLLLTSMETGGVAGGGFADGGRGFFNLVRTHTLEGFLADPMYGGNHDFLGWQVLGFNGVQLFFSAEAQALNGKDDREPRSIADYGGEPLP